MSTIMRQRSFISLFVLAILLGHARLSLARDLGYRATLRRTIDFSSTETLKDESRALQVEKHPGLCRFLDATSRAEFGSFTLEGEGPVFTLAPNTLSGLPLRAILGIMPPLDVRSLTATGSGTLAYSVKCENGQTLDLAYAYTVEKSPSGTLITLHLNFDGEYWGDGLLWSGQTTIADSALVHVDSQGELVSLQKSAKLISIRKSSTPVAYSIVNTTSTTTFEFDLRIGGGSQDSATQGETPTNAEPK